MYTLLADAVVVVHFAFILFVLFGGFVVIVWRNVAWVHIPAFIWGALTEFLGLICPLTPLENSLRQLGEGEGYSGDFVFHYLLPVIYPSGLTQEVQWVLGGVLVVANMLIYSYVWWHLHSHRKRSNS